MRRQLRWMTFVFAGVLALAGAYVARLQAQAQGQPSQLPTETITAIRINAGQSVTPYYEGWIRNPDGTSDMVFGYFNRNYVEEFAIPAGPNNKVEPGSIDQGQPTYFLPRRQRYVYRVRVPADFGKKEVVWTVTANGRSERGFGMLIPEQEITERVVMTNGNFDPGHGDPNKPPSITIASVAAVSVGSPVTLTASVVDDGLPKPRPVAPRPPPTTTGGFGAQVNSSGGGPPRGTTVNWLQYSGPAKVTFGHTGSLPVTDGKAVTTASFAAPGTYKLVASASDPGRLSTRTEVVVTVAAARSTSGQQP
jgi:hypothetical protein